MGHLRWRLHGRQHSAPMQALLLAGVNQPCSARAPHHPSWQAQQGWSSWQSHQHMGQGRGRVVHALQRYRAAGSIIRHHSMSAGAQGAAATTTACPMLQWVQHKLQLLQLLALCSRRHPSLQLQWLHSLGLQGWWHSRQRTTTATSTSSSLQCADPSVRLLPTCKPASARTLQSLVPTAQLLTMTCFSTWS